MVDKLAGIGVNITWPLPLPALSDTESVAEADSEASDQSQETDPQVCIYRASVKKGWYCGIKSSAMRCFVRQSGIVMVGT